MVALLKQKSKVSIKHKDRKKWELADVFKQRKIQEENKNDAPNSQHANQNKAVTQRDKNKIKPQILEKFDVEMEKKWIINSVKII